MGKRNTCPLCGDRLVNGYCRFCGHDFNKNKARYRLNEAGYSGMERYEKELVRDLEKKDKAQEKSQQDRAKELQRHAKAHETASKVAPPPRKNKAKVEKKKGGKGCGCLIFLLIIIFSLVPSFGKIKNFIQDKIDGSRSSSYTSTYKDDSAASKDHTGGRSDSSPQDASQEEDAIPKTGESYEANLTPGAYEVGVDIPEGDYTVDLVQGSGGVTVSDFDRNYYEYNYFSTDNEEGDVTHWDATAFYQGCMLEIGNNAEIKISTDNAQKDKMKPKDNPVTKPVTLEKDQKLTAGQDFEPGIYDVAAKGDASGYALLYVDVPADKKYYENGYRTTTVWLDQEDASKTWHHLVLPKGTVIYIDSSDAASVDLTPTPKIGDREYISYYNM